MADQRKDVKMKDRLKTLKIYGIQIYLLFEKGYMKTMNLSDPPITMELPMLKSIGA